jgi:predicted dehydrogenase
LEEIGIGVVGCGNISTIYLTNLPHVPGAKVRACADMKLEVAEAQGARFGVPAMAVDELLARNDIQIVVNLTVPAAHGAVSLSALSAGKHVFSEKPLAIDADLGRTVVAEAESRNLMVGCAPDTFLGAGGRLTRKLLDDGVVGRILSGTAFLMSHGMEHWHPDPEFFFKKGGGPVLDVGPYYITALVNLLGPVARVTSITSTGFPERIVTSEGPRNGYRIEVETPTTAYSLLEFAAGPQIVFGATWDVWKHSHPPIELYGTEGSLRVPDPNFYGGIVETSDKNDAWVQHDSEAMPLGRANWPAEAPTRANYRALGVADMIAALRSGRAYHASGKLALHVLEVMEAVVNGGTTELTPAERPAAFEEGDAAVVFDASVAPAALVPVKRPARKRPAKKAAKKRTAKKPAAKKARAKKPVPKKVKRPAAKKPAKKKTAAKKRPVAKKKPAKKARRVAAKKRRGR